MSDSWDKRAKPSADNSFLLKEDAFYLLLETGEKIVIDYGDAWSTRTKPSN